MRSPTKNTLTILFTAAVAISIFFHCSKIVNTSADDTESSDAAQFYADEISNMSANSSSAISSATSKVLQRQGDTTTVDWVIHPFAWDAGSESYVRSASMTTSKGYERVRIDTVTYFDSSDNKLRFPTVKKLAKIHHVRHVTHSKGGREVQNCFNLWNAFSPTPEPTLVQNGIMTGTFNDEAISTGTITDVTRRKIDGRWQMPESGIITLETPKRIIIVEYTGSGAAMATLHNKLTNVTKVITINVDEQ
ncbi:MAG: hypothetical protein JW795_20175 [Chitinivibrionales bacterium]|nr:hypothetical protein [Chitinivibrionales bacterium]